MKQWAIPVSWEVAGVVIISANTLEEAIHAAKHDDSIGLPSGEYVDGSFDVTIDDDDCIRNFYNWYCRSNSYINSYKGNLCFRRKERRNIL